MAPRIHFDTALLAPIICLNTTLQDVSDGHNGRNYWLDDIYLAVILMLLTDMGSSKLVAARIHNLKSIFHAFCQFSIRIKYSVSKVFEIFEK